MPRGHDPTARLRACPRRWLPLSVVVVLVISGTALREVSAAFVASRTNSGNSVAAAATFPTYPTAVVNDSPLFYHRLNDAADSVTAADSSGNGLTGVHTPDHATGAGFLAPFDEGAGSTVKDLSGAATPRNLTAVNMAWAAGYTGTAGSFNGTSSYAASSGAVVTTTASFSVSAWVYLTAVGGYRTAVSQDGTNVSRFYLQYDHSTGKWRFTLPQSDSTAAAGDLVASSAAATLNAWTHLVGSYDSTTDTIRLYVDGVLQGTASHFAAWSALGSLNVGAAKFTTRGDWWAGRVDDVRTYARALSQLQVTDLYNGASGRLSLSYPFAENTGTTTSDQSGNGRTGTFGSGATWTTGKSGAGVAFNGTSSGYVSAGAATVDPARSFTVSAWVYLTNNSVLRTAMAQDGTSVSPFYLQVGPGVTGKWQWTLFPADNTATYNLVYSSAAASLNTWTHLVGVYDAAAGQGRFYVNGDLQGTVGISLASWTTAGNVILGRGKWGGNPVDFFAGRIDDARTYRRALSAAEAATLYNAGAGDAPTLGYLHLGQPGALQGAQQGQGSTTAADFLTSTNGYNPTNYTNPTTFSVECWFKSSNAGGGTVMDFGNRADGNSTTFSRRIQLTATGTVIFGSVNGATNTVESGPGYLDGTWHHVVATLSPTTGMALYLDGKSVGRLAYPGASVHSGVWRWGGDTHNASWPSPDYFVGQIDEVAVYGTVLTAQQVAWHYNANH